MTTTDASNIPPQDDENEGEGLTPAVTAAPADTATAPKAGKAAAPKAPKAAQSAKAESIAAANVQKRVRIILEENDNIPPTGQFFGINGKSYILRPGEEANVPVDVVEALNDAVEDSPVLDGNGNVSHYRSRMRFPYRLLGPA